MTTEKRIKILTESEVQEFYSPPLLTANDQRFFFALNERERQTCKTVRQRRARCMLVLLLGYFKAKPVVLMPRYHQLKADLTRCLSWRWFYSIHTRPERKRPYLQQNIRTYWLSRLVKQRPSPAFTRLPKQSGASLVGTTSSF